MIRPPHSETHFVNRIGWLRAAVLGANDGIVSTASLIVGVAAAAATRNDILIAGVAGLVAGAMSMAAGEYVSVSSQSDTRMYPARFPANLELHPNHPGCVKKLMGQISIRCWLLRTTRWLLNWRLKWQEFQRNLRLRR